VSWPGDHVQLVVSLSRIVCVQQQQRTPSCSWMAMTPDVDIPVGRGLRGGEGEYGAVCGEVCNIRASGCSVGWCRAAARALPTLPRAIFAAR
jgi:hypothetical protein